MKKILLITSFIILLTLIIILSIVKFVTEISGTDNIPLRIENPLRTENTVMSRYDQFVIQLSMDFVFRRWRDNHSREASERFPYLVAIIAHKDKGFFSCFGCFIQTKWVLTAAHCKRPEQSHRVLLYSDFANNSTHTYPVGLWRVHEKFKSSTNDPKYDIAVARVDLIGDSTVSRTVGLEGRRTGKFQASVWKTVYMAMYSRTFLTNNLEIYTFSLASDTECCKTYGITHSNYDSSLVCVDMSQHMDCYITEFGPLFDYSADFISGLLTTRKPEDCKSKIAIFTNVPYYRDWILRATKS